MAWISGQAALLLLPSRWGRLSHPATALLCNRRFPPSPPPWGEARQKRLPVYQTDNSFLYPRGGVSVGKVRFEGQGHFSNGGAMSIVGRCILPTCIKMHRRSSVKTKKWVYEQRHWTNNQVRNIIIFCCNPRWVMLFRKTTESWSIVKRRKRT